MTQKPAPTSTLKQMLSTGIETIDTTQHQPPLHKATHSAFVLLATLVQNKHWSTVDRTGVAAVCV